MNLEFDLINYLEQEKVVLQKRQRAILQKKAKGHLESVNDQLLFLDRIFKQIHQLDQELITVGLKRVNHFIKGKFYLIKAIDHFTGSKDQEFFNVIGFFLKEDDYYYFFQSYFYDAEHSEQEYFNVPQKTGVVKGTIIQCFEMVAKK